MTAPYQKDFCAGGVEMNGEQLFAEIIKHQKTKTNLRKTWIYSRMTKAEKIFTLRQPLYISKDHFHKRIRTEMGGKKGAFAICKLSMNIDFH